MTTWQQISNFRRSEGGFDHETTRFILVRTCSFLLAAGLALAADPPAAWKGQDIGKVGSKGSVADDKGKLTIKASGSDVGGKEDACYFVSQPLSGDGSIVARLVSIEKTDDLANAGVMIRASNKPDAANAFVCIGANKGAAFQRRASAGADTESSPASNPDITVSYWVKLVREGDKFSAYFSKDGTSWEQIDDTYKLKLDKDALVGLAVTLSQ